MNEAYETTVTPHHYIFTCDVIRPTCCSKLYGSNWHCTSYTHIGEHGDEADALHDWLVAVDLHL